MEITFYMSSALLPTQLQINHPLCHHTHTQHTQSLDPFARSYWFSFRPHLLAAHSGFLGIFLKSFFPWSTATGLFSLSLFFQSIWFALGRLLDAKFILGSTSSSQAVLQSTVRLSVNLTSGDLTLHQRNTKSRLIAEDPAFKTRSGLV